MGIQHRTPHVYDLGGRTWYCIDCDTDCSRDDMPCPCCFDSMPVVNIPKNGASDEPPF